MLQIRDTLLFTSVLNLFCLSLVDSSPLRNLNSNSQSESYIRQIVEANSNDDDKPWRDEMNLWLEDFEQETEKKKDQGYYDYLMQGDDPGGGENQASLSTPDVGNSICPQYQLSDDQDDLCNQDKCETDSQCGESNLKCCYNGCVNACLPVSTYIAPLIDWALPPRPKNPGSSSWLLEDPVNDQANSSRKVCILNRRAYADKEVFRYEKHTCLCNNGDITCQVYSQEEGLQKTASVV